MNMSCESSSRAGVDGTGRKSKQAMRVSEHSNIDQRDYGDRVMFLLPGVAVSCLLVFSVQLMVLPPWKPNFYSARNATQSILETKKPVSELERVLMDAAMEDKTVIITAINQAWAAPNATFDVFRESFRVGEGTEKLLKHVIAVCMDSKAFARCLAVHPHCYFVNMTDSDGISGPNQFMTRGYLKLIWRRMEVLREVLALGYSFIFTDADIVWLRDPFPRFFPDADFQITCDIYNGKPSDKNNLVNSGFTYVKANNKTANFYEFWCNSSRRFPNKHEQDVFNLIKNDPFIAKIGIKMRFFDTVYFGGLCQPSRDINVVNAMHANCCVGLDNKVKYLKIVLDDWKKYLTENTTVTKTEWNIKPKSLRKSRHLTTAF